MKQIILFLLLSLNLSAQDFTVNTRDQWVVSTQQELVLDKGPENVDYRLFVIGDRAEIENLKAGYTLPYRFMYKDTRLNDSGHYYHLFFCDESQTTLMARTDERQFIICYHWSDTYGRYLRMDIYYKP